MAHPIKGSLHNLCIFVINWFGNYKKQQKKNKKKSDKVLELVGGGPVMNGAYPV